MGKEIKIGLAVVTVLLGILGFVIYKKFVVPPPLDRPADLEMAEAAPAPAAPAKLSSGPAQPTVLPASAAVKPPATPHPKPSTPTKPSPTAAAPTPRQQATSSDASTTAPRTPQSSYLPESNDSSSYDNSYRTSRSSRYGQSPQYDMTGTSSDESASVATDDDAAASPEDTSGRRNRLRDRDRYASPYANYDLYGEAKSDPPADPFQAGSATAENPSAPDEPTQAPARIEAEDAAPLDTTADRYRHHRTIPQDDATSLHVPDQGSNANRRQPPAASSFANPEAYDVYGRNAPRQPAAAPPQTTAARPPMTPAPQRPASGPIPASPDQPTGQGAAGDQYVVQPNDNYWEISRKKYGTGDYFKALFEHNRTQFPRPDQLRPGAVIECPNATALAQTYPDLCPTPRQQQASQRMAQTVSTRGRFGHRGRVYQVEQGDTLFDIARLELGKASRWAEIYDLNRELLGNDIDYLKPGMELVLPTDTPDVDPVAQQPSDAWRR